MKKFVNRIFEFKEKVFLTPNLFPKKAYFGQSKSSKDISFDKETLLACLNYLIDNSYVIYNKSVYNWISMGTNCAPHIANIYLHVYENEYVEKLIENNDLKTLEKFKDIFRFQDDLFSVNDDGIFENILSTMYPREMVISKTNISPSVCSYLDLLNSVYKGKFKINLFDKRDDYKFKVFRYPYLDGNIPETLSYGIFISQIIRFCSINSTFIGFHKDVKSHVVKLCKQGFKLAALRNRFYKFYECKINLWGKYGVDIYDKMIKIFDE